MDKEVSAALIESLKESTKVLREVTGYFENIADILEKEIEAEEDGRID